MLDNCMDRERRLGWRCQERSLEEQLAMGCRYFDLRVNADNEGVHASCRLGIYMEEVFGTFAAFLKAHPGEFILARYQPSLESNVSPEIGVKRLRFNTTRLLKDISPLLWSNKEKKTSPSLAEVRGKVVMLDDSPHDRLLDEAGVSLPWSGASGGPLSDGQDYFSKPGPEKKFAAITSFCLEHQDLSRLRMNHTSATSDLTPVEYAAYIHPRLEAWFEAHQALNLGVMIFDFVTPRLAATVYGRNFCAQTAS
jgi:1-phosphatidylinositol phosphodiesterase